MVPCLCSSCTKKVYEQFFTDLVLFQKLDQSDEKIILFIKLSFAKALLEFFKYEFSLNSIVGPALLFYHSMHFREHSTFLKRWKANLSSLFQSAETRHKTALFIEFPTRDQVVEAFRDQLVDCRRVTYRLQNGLTVVTERKLHGDEILLPRQIYLSDEPAHLNIYHSSIRSVNRHELKKADVLRVDDSLLRVQDCRTTEFAHHTILLMVDYLTRLMSFDDVFTRLKQHFSGDSYPSLCLNCRGIFKQLNWHRAWRYDYECPGVAFDVALAMYYSRVASITARDLDSLGVAAEYMTTVHPYHRYREEGRVLDDDDGPF